MDWYFSTFLLLKDGDSFMNIGKLKYAVHCYGKNDGQVAVPGKVPDEKWTF